MKRILSLLICAVLLVGSFCIPVSAESAASSVNLMATVNSEGDCFVTMTVNLRLEASAEKHIPVPSVNGSVVKVAVGSVAHPMIEAHYISWIYLQTTVGGQRKNLVPGAAPEVTFALAEGETPVAVYAYCNLHGLWKADI